ncbi:septal ring lytic transglycosylase RlpA family protein [Ramlibacter sp. H39-3-26]|uniref:septal ring lytic transglycosylase RlpA family protein n=1 Tax=Curvibacter soli TaxID=3031331 RepID=UPI0023DBBE5A|nr:septal ring lytic transglycosylase RlpA family protein [Ramlibacter sp. H39-3-26]MDF1484459.1 septal ring lytic transglycosylase RlpA family protein [Ramlibacter sp. H39-3-26]
MARAAEGRPPRRAGLWLGATWALCWALGVHAQQPAEDGAVAPDAPPAASGMDDDGFSLFGMPGAAAPRDAGVFFERGGASWYGLRFHRRRTASGERYDMAAYTAAHRTLPFGTLVCVRSLVNGREVPVRINDRGPHVPGRIIDLSRAAAEAIGMMGLGIKEVALFLPGETGHACGGAR